ncbi:MULTISPECIES: type II toxin-antitoxin system VapB family antitoxin [Streptomyces]|uniref:type II toxin-antitoxin system VapB family antitoxin n=1 Tax=Streptomyces TaxID=1883 RepID=UPI002E7A487F|nr:type II toxin-antitoxin system VapB family antitoxin [Streptomyces sp. BE282]MEE1730896.1 type II toxin-antitoxin system VapB family antitoxin [Streptomyces sp. BE282]
MSVQRINLDRNALDRVVALSDSRTKSEAVNLALRFYAEQPERAGRISLHFERAYNWSAAADAERRHRAEKEGR